MSVYLRPIWQLWVQSWCEPLGLQDRPAPAGCGRRRGWIAPPSPSGVAELTEPFYRRGGKCWVSVSHRGNSCNYTPQPLPSSPCLPHQRYPLCPNILLTPFPSPVELLLPSWPSALPRPFVLCFTAVNVTWVTLSLLSTDGPLFATLLKKTPAHISCFLIFTMCQWALFLPVRSAITLIFFRWMPEFLSLHRFSTFSARDSAQLCCCLYLPYVNTLDSWSECSHVRLGFFANLNLS